MCAEGDMKKKEKKEEEERKEAPGRFYILVHRLRDFGGLGIEVEGSIDVSGWRWVFIVVEGRIKRCLGLEVGFYCGSRELVNRKYGG